MLWVKDRPGANVVFRGARVLDPVEGIDAVLDVRIDGGTIAALGEGLDTNEHRVVDARGLVLAPAFVDPHVTLHGKDVRRFLRAHPGAYDVRQFPSLLAMLQSVGGFVAGVLGDIHA